MTNKNYQTNFSSIYSHNKEYESNRLKKAKKTVSVIKDALGKSLNECLALEIGCFKGDISIHSASSFKTYYAIDIDELAIAEASKKEKPANLMFSIGNAEALEFEDGSIDVVLCSHVYEHVPNPETMMNEIRRVLKKDGICYFAAGNKLKIIEPHYKLPFLSWLPKPLAHLYLKITGNGNFYYETLRTVWGIKKLTHQFIIEPYSLKILEEPEKFESDDMIIPGSLKQKLGIMVYKYFNFMFPTFIWILKQK